MKVINSLIAVEVPRGGSCWINNKTLWIRHEGSYEPNEFRDLPFPAEIIGLASEIDSTDKVDIMIAAKSDWFTEWLYFTSIHSLTTTPTTDIIFLRKKL